MIQILRSNRRFIVPILFSFLCTSIALAQATESTFNAENATVPRKEVKPNELSTILKNHLLWLKGETRGKKADFDQTDLKGRNLNGVDLEKANFIQADLSQVNLSRAKLSRAVLSRAVLIGADLSEANMGHADLSWVDFSDANLGWADLSNADLSRANLSRAKFNGADLSSTDLARAKFSRTDLNGAILSRSILKRADLSSAVGLSEVVWGDGVYYNAKTKWPPEFLPPRNLGTLQGKTAFFIDNYWLEIVLFSLLCLASIVYFTVRTWKLEIQEQKNQIVKQERVLKEKTSVATGIVDYVEAALQVASEREKLAMYIANGRSRRLFIIGSFLMVLSVFAPLGSAVIYWQTDPFNDNAVMRLERFINNTGIELGKESVSFNKDWRVLFSGLSFGFLFLAAARGILRQ